MNFAQESKLYFASENSSNSSVARVFSSCNESLIDCQGMNECKEQCVPNLLENFSQLNPNAQTFIPSRRNTTHCSPRSFVRNPDATYFFNSDENHDSTSPTTTATSPCILDISTPNETNKSLSPKKHSELKYEKQSSDLISPVFLDISPSILDISTPIVSYSRNIGEVASGIKPCSLFVQSSSNLDANAHPFIPNEHPTQISSDKESPSTILQNLRLKNIDKIIIGHININSIRNKIDLLFDEIRGKMDILLISETKLDNTFPPGQFFRSGYSEPHRLDRTANGGGLLLYLRSDIPVKPLPLINNKIECIMVEITISKKKWLVIGTYNPNKSMILNHLSVLEESLCHYLSLYDNVLVIGDFNSEIREEAMDDFCELYHLKSLIKTPTCFKSAENPSCIDLMLTNRPHNFQHSSTLETGLSDFHLLTVTVLKTNFRKKPPKIVRYRDYKHYSPNKLQNDLNFSLAGIDLNRMSNDDYVALLMGILDRHAPLKMKYIRANNQPFMTKELRKEHMKRTKLRNRYHKDKSTTNEIAYKKQRNLCVNLLKKVKRKYFENLKPSHICDNKKFWKTVKPLFSEKSKSTDNITLVENNKMVTDDQQVAEIFNSFFSNAVKNLNIDYYEHFSFDQYLLCNINENEDPVKKAIDKYVNHPSIVKIKENFPTSSTFSFKPVDLEAVNKEIANLKESKSCPIDSIPVKIIKDTLDTTGPKIMIDFNSSINTGDFPYNMKLADITPLHKKENKQSKLNYRPLISYVKNFRNINATPNK